MKKITRKLSLSRENVRQVRELAGRELDIAAALGFGTGSPTMQTGPQCDPKPPAVGSGGESS